MVSFVIGSSAYDALRLLGLGQVLGDASQLPQKHLTVDAIGHGIR